MGEGADKAKYGRRIRRKRKEKETSFLSPPFALPTRNLEPNDFRVGRSEQRPRSLNIVIIGCQSDGSPNRRKG